MQAAEIVKTIFYGVDLFFLLYLVCYSTFLLLSVLVGSLSLYEQKQRQGLYNYVHHDYFLPITIIVPAYNESITIIDTVESLFDLDYRLYEIIVVDDGSSDDTAQCLIHRYHLQEIQSPIRKKIPCSPEKSIHVSYEHKVPLTLIRKENGGKGDALNMGINAAEYPYFICMDADSVLQGDALRNIIRPVLEEPDVVAVGGLIRIVNDVVIEKGKVISYKMPKKLILCMQVLEYDRTFLAARLFFDRFNGNLIISGAYGLFRKDLVIRIGGYNRETLGEDMELVVRLHAFCRANQIPYRIRYAADAICWSQAPASLKDLRQQRRRWHLGLFQSIMAHRQILFNPQYGALSFISFLYFLVYELLSPYIEVLGIFTIAVACCFNLVNVPFMVLFFGIYAAFSALMSLTAFFSRIYSMNIRLHFKDFAKAIGLCMVENVGLRMILAYTRLTAFIGYQRKKQQWGQIERSKINKEEEISG